MGGQKRGGRKRDAGGGDEERGERAYDVASVMPSQPSVLLRLERGEGRSLSWLAEGRSLFEESFGYSFASSAGPSNTQSGA